MTVSSPTPEHRQLVIWTNMAVNIHRSEHSMLDEHDSNYTQTRIQKIGNLYEHGGNYT